MTRRWPLWLMLMSSAAWSVTPAERMDQWKDAINRASEAGNLERTQAYRRELADYAASVGDHVEAVRQYELLLALRPRRRERALLFDKLGQQREALKNFQSAISAYQDALHDERNSFEANLDLARVYSKVDLNSRAIQMYKKCVSVNPRDMRPYMGMGDAYSHLGYVAKAIDSYKKAIAIKPAPEAYLGMADCYAREGDIPHATGILLQGKAVLPQAEYDVRLGDLYHKLGDLKRASISWESALAADAQRDDVRLKLAMIYDRLDRRADTDKMLKRLLSQYPDSPLVHFVAAWIFMNRGDREASRRESARVRSLAPTEVVQHFNERLLQLKQ